MARRQFSEVGCCWELSRSSLVARSASFRVLCWWELYHSIMVARCDMTARRSIRMGALRCELGNSLHNPNSDTAYDYVRDAVVQPSGVGDSATKWGSCRWVRTWDGKYHNMHEQNEAVWLKEERIISASAAYRQYTTGSTNSTTVIFQRNRNQYYQHCKSRAAMKRQYELYSYLHARGGRFWFKIMLVL